jgi:hypothetical protein
MTAAEQFPIGAKVRLRGITKKPGQQEVKL